MLLATFLDLLSSWRTIFPQWCHSNQKGLSFALSYVAQVSWCVSVFFFRTVTASPSTPFGGWTKKLQWEG